MTLTDEAPFQFVVVVVTVGVWAGTMWRFRHAIRKAWPHHRGRVATQLVFTWVVVLVGLVRPLVETGVLSADMLDFAWGMLRGTTLLVGLAYLWAGPTR